MSEIIYDFPEDYADQVLQEDQDSLLDDDCPDGICDSFRSDWVFLLWPGSAFGQESNSDGGGQDELMGACDEV